MLAALMIGARAAPSDAIWDTSRKSLREKRVLLLLCAAVLSQGG
jgi:hypothetical protein